MISFLGMSVLLETNWVDGWLVVLIKC